MIWLTWRQFRVQALAAVVAMAALAIALATTGPNLARRYAHSGLSSCHTNCGRLTDSFLHNALEGLPGTLRWLGAAVLLALPAIVGMFWGAPLVAREFEAGTYRLTWNQSVTRTRWLMVKLLGVGLASVLTAGLLSLAVTWWASPIDKASMNRFLPQVFAARGIAPVGYAAFAFVLGVAVGAIVRRTVPAMAITLVLVVAVQLVLSLLIRPHLMTPVSTTGVLDRSVSSTIVVSEDNRMSIYVTPDSSGDWLLSSRTVTGTGAPFHPQIDPSVCGPGVQDPGACLDWIDAQHLRYVATYQPADRFWTFQWYETGLLFGLTVLLAGCCVWWVRRRLT